MTNSSQLHSADPTQHQNQADQGEMLTLLKPEALIYIVNIIG